VRGESDSGARKGSFVALDIVVSAGNLEGS